MDRKKEKLIREEQKILDKTIKQLDGIMVKQKKVKSRNDLEIVKKRSNCLADVYMDIATLAGENKRAEEKYNECLQAKGDLYKKRLMVKACAENYDDSVMKKEFEMKVGLHDYPEGVEIYSWRNPIAREFLMPNVTEFTEEIEDAHDPDITYRTHYTLEQCRDIKIYFDRIEDVMQSYPVEEEEKTEITDAFLQQLLQQRSSKEFQNIVFSIQKNQAKIIQSPYERNMLVQGCAGSGKSMIMLHRLPLVLFDHPSEIGRKGVYIVSPSKAYIQMAEQLRVQLEIEDLPMGTLDDYYDYLIDKYRRQTVVDINFVTREQILTEEEENYLYSKQCIEDINQTAKEMVDKCYVDLHPIYEKLEMQADCFYSQNELMDQLSPYSSMLEDALVECNSRLRATYAGMKKPIDLLCSIGVEAGKYRSSIQKRADDMIKRLEREVEKEQKKIKKNNSDGKNHTVANANAEKKIQNYKDDIAKYREEAKYIATVQDNKEIEIAEQLSRVVKAFANKYFKFRYEPYDERNWKQGFKLLLIKGRVLQLCDAMLRAFHNLQDSFLLEYEIGLKHYSKDVMEVKEEILNLPRVTLENEIQEVEEAAKIVADLLQNLPEKVFKQVASKIKQENRWGKIPNFTGARYLYLQTLYQLKHVPNSSQEVMVCIDEAQGLAVEELRLLHLVNDQKTIFNLYGDIRQYIEHTKGIDDWSKLKEVFDFDEYCMDENYRNARQITTYCNENIEGITMLPVQLKGGGVHVWDESSEEELLRVLTEDKPDGLTALIVKNEKDLALLKLMLSDCQEQLNFMAETGNGIVESSWNVFTVAEAKGLEFHTVIVFTGDMTDNERYVSCTRAMDTLYVYNPKLEEEKEQDAPEETLKEPDIVAELEEETPQKPLGHEVTDFFIDKGYKVNDMREQGGEFWIYGEKEALIPIVTDAVKSLRISGKFGTDCKGKSGWRTKSRK